MYCLDTGQIDKWMLFSQRTAVLFKWKFEHRHVWINTYATWMGFIFYQTQLKSSISLVLASRIFSWSEGYVNSRGKLEIYINHITHSHKKRGHCVTADVNGSALGRRLLCVCWSCYCANQTSNTVVHFEWRHLVQRNDTEPLWNVLWNYLSIPKLQLYNGWCLGMQPLKFRNGN